MGAINAREEFGGSGLTRFDAALIFEALAMGCPTIAAYLSIHNMCAWLIDAFGLEAAIGALGLPRLATMDALSSYCLTEPGSGSDAAALARAAPFVSGDHYVLEWRESSSFRARAPAATGISTLSWPAPAETEPNGVSALVVEGGTPGLNLGAHGAKDGLERAADARRHVRGLPRAGREPARTRGRRLQNRHGRRWTGAG